MKSKIILFILSLFVFEACTRKPEPNLELFNPEAFAYDLSDYWEVNATVRAKGFNQVEREDVLIFRLSYSVDVITTENDTIKSIFEDWVEEESSEEFIDAQIEAQVEIDSSLGVGDYKLIFHVKDELFDQSKSITVDFNLSK